MRKSLTKDKMNEYKVAGKCFKCSDMGHLSKDRPRQMMVRPPAHLHSAGAAVDYASIDRLHSFKSATTLGLMSVGLISTDISTQENSAVDSVLIASLLMKLYRAVPFVFDYDSNPENWPYSLTCFRMIPCNEVDFMIYDWHTNDEHLVMRVQLLDPLFDLIQWIFVEKCAIEDQLLTGLQIPRPIPEPMLGFLRSTTRDGELSGDDHPSEQLLTLLRVSLLIGTPYHFNDNQGAGRARVYTTDQFQIKTSERP